MADEGYNNMTQPDSVGNLIGDSHLGNLDNYSSSAFQSEPLQPQPSAPHPMSGSMSSSNPLDDDFGFDSHISSNTVNTRSNPTSSGSNNSAPSSSSYTPGELISNTYNPVDHDSNYNSSHDIGENINLDNSNYGMSDSSPPPPSLPQHQLHLNDPSSKDDELDSGESDSDDNERNNHGSLVSGQTVLTSKHSDDQHSKDEYDDDDGESSLIEYNNIEDNEVDAVKDNDFVYSTATIADSPAPSPKSSLLDSSLSPQAPSTLQTPLHNEMSPYDATAEGTDTTTVSQYDVDKIKNSFLLMSSDDFITSTTDTPSPSSSSVPVTGFGYDDPQKFDGVAPSCQSFNDLAPEIVGDGGVDVAGSDDEDDEYSNKRRSEIPEQSSQSMSTPVVVSGSSFSQPSPLNIQPHEVDPDPYCTSVKHQIAQSTNENLFSSEPDSSSEPTVETGPKEAQLQSTLEGPWLKKIDPKEQEPEISLKDLHGYNLILDLIYWRDVKKTAVVFGSMLFILLSLAIYSVLTVIAYLSLAILAVTLSFRVYKNIMQAVQKSGDGHPFKEYLEYDIELNEQKTQKVIKLIMKHTNSTVQELRRLFLIEDLVDSLKFGLLLWVLTYIGSWFNGMTIIINCVVIIFTLPKIYETYKVQIDNYLAMARSQFNKILQQVQSKLPFLKKKAKAQ
ncbi:reticulon-1-like [Argonauta hians]